MARTSKRYCDQIQIGRVGATISAPVIRSRLYLRAYCSFALSHVGRRFISCGALWHGVAGAAGVD